MQKIPLWYFGMCPSQAGSTEVRKTVYFNVKKKKIIIGVYKKKKNENTLKS